DMKVVSRLQPALGAVANRRAEVRLVWRPVLGKPRVAVDAEHRFFRIDRPERAIELRYSGGDVADQRLEFLAQHVVSRLVPGEPRPVVVLLEPGQEFDERLDVHETAVTHPPM